MTVAVVFIVSITKDIAVLLQYTFNYISRES